MANLNAILPNRKQNQRKGGYSKENVQEIFGTSEIDVLVASDVKSVNAWDEAGRQYTDQVAYQYVYVELRGGDPFKIKFPANADLSSIVFADNAKTVELEACNIYDYKNRQRNTYFKAASLKKVK